MVKIQSIYNRERPEGLSFLSTTSLAQQNFAEEADINYLVGRWMKTGQMYDRPGTRVPQYLDVSNVEDFRTMTEQLMQIGDYFDSLPSKTRAIFENDPEVMMEFLSDPANADEAATLGLVPSKEETPPPAPVEPPKSPPPPAKAAEPVAPPPPSDQSST